MNNQDLRDLLPVRQCLEYPGLPETTEAITAIESAHAALVTAHTETVNRILAIEESHRDERKGPIWREFQAGALRDFYLARGEAGGRALAAVENELRMMEADATSREKNIAAGLGRLLGDPQAGHDLAVMLMRLTGGVAVDDRLQDARRGWHTLVRVSAHLVNDLPAAPVATPSEAGQNAVEGLIETMKQLEETEGAK